MTWFVKTYYIELDLGERLELGRKNCDTAHSEGGERVVSLASSTRHIGERWVLMLGGAMERDIFFSDDSQENSTNHDSQESSTVDADGDEDVNGGRDEEEL